MFGSSNPFGQPSSSNLFGSQTQSMFGQTYNPSRNPFGAQMGSSMFGGTSTGVFGQPQASSPFGVSSASGQTSFGFSTPPQSSPFGNNTHHSQPVNNGFGSSGAASTSAFGVSSTPSLGFSSSPAFGSSPAPAFGTSGSLFGNNGFGSSPAFGVSSTPAVGVASTPSFSFGSSPAFGQPTSAFSSTQSPFAQAPTPTSGGSRVRPYAPISMTDLLNNKTSVGTLRSISGMHVYEGKSHEELRLEDYQKGDKGGQLSTGQFPGGSGFSVTNSQPPSPLFSQTSASSANGFSSSTSTNPFALTTPSTSNFLSSPFGQPTTPSPFGSTSSTTTNVFGPSTSFPTAPSQSLFASSSNPGFTSSPSFTTSGFRSSNPGFASSPSTTTNGFGPSTNFAIAPSQSLFPSSSNPGFTSNGFATTPSQSLFASSSNPGFTSSPSTTTNIFGSSGSFATAPSQSLFASSSSPGFTSSPSTTTNIFGTSGSFATNPSQSLFSSSSSPGFSSFSSTFASVPANGSTPAFSNGFSFNNSQPSPVFSSIPSIGQPGQNTNPAYNFSTPSTGMGNLFSSTPSLNTSSSPFQTNPAGLIPNQSPQPAQIGAGGMVSFSQVPASVNSVVMQPMPFTNPFGTLPALPQISIAQGGNTPSIQYGISSRPVVDKPVPARTSPLLTLRHISQRRVRAPLRKYRPGDDGPKVPFFSDEENWNTPKANALLFPRENPRALLIRREKSAPPKDGHGHTPLQENQGNCEIRDAPLQENKGNGEIRDTPLVENSSPSGVDIKSLMPKLEHCEYFTEPRIQELAAKERVDPGYCNRVRDFVVGRHGYGNIKFLGETDVRKLDLESLVQFNKREVIVYMDESKKPPVGEELNKPAEVTLLNIKCMDKKSGKQVKEGSRVDKFKEKLKTKTEEQGAQFVSYDAVNGEWKFRVEHFG